jgi:hypothetical protein
VNRLARKILVNIVSSPKYGDIMNPKALTWNQFKELYFQNEFIVGTAWDLEFCYEMWNKIHTDLDYRKEVLGRWFPCV